MIYLAEKKPLIMLVEDSMLFQKYLTNLVNLNGYDSISVTDGLAAIELLYTLRPDLILLDINLPGMDGYDVCSHIRNTPSMNDIPIIFITSNEDDDAIVKGFEVGGNDYVIKPIVPIILQARIKNQLAVVHSKEMMNRYIDQLETLNDKLKLEKEYTEQLANRDYLTRAYNRRYLQDKLGLLQSMKPNNRHVFSLAIIDIDDFKKINDTYGHDAGDYVLKELVLLLNRHLRQHDLLSRWGGEEFMILLPDTDDELAYNLLEHLRTLVHQHRFIYNKKALPISFTAGISSTHTSCCEKIFIHVDEALYFGKRHGKNRVIIYKELLTPEHDKTVPQIS